MGADARRRPEIKVAAPSPSPQLSGRQMPHRGIPSSRHGAQNQAKAEASGMKAQHFQQNEDHDPIGPSCRCMTASLRAVARINTARLVPR